MEFGFSLFMIGIVFVISIVLFILLREFWCWYFKINERNKYLYDTLIELQNIKKLLKSNMNVEDSSISNKNNFLRNNQSIGKGNKLPIIDATAINTSLQYTSDGNWICPKCNEKNPKNKRECNGCSYKWVNISF